MRLVWLPDVVRCLAYLILMKLWDVMLFFRTHLEVATLIDERKNGIGDGKRGENQPRTTTGFFKFFKYF
jgi:hypothetical protein